MLGTIRAPLTRMYHVTRVFGLANIPARSPQNMLIFMIHESISGIEASQKDFIYENKITARDAKYAMKVYHRFASPTDAKQIKHGDFEMLSYRRTPNY